MAELVTPSKLQPKIVTLEELRQALLPFCRGWTWAEDAIHDLWLLGGPCPTHHTDGVERRVLLPTQFAKWWFEVSQRMGIEASGPRAYQTLVPN